MENSATETWKDIEGFEGYYKVSSKGRVKRLARTLIKGTGWANKAECRIPEKILKPYISKGDLWVCFVLGGKRTVARVGMLVARAFVENHDGKEAIKYKDGDKRHNYPDNIEWCTKKDLIKNVDYSRNGGHNKRKVSQLDSDGEIIKTYESIKSASSFVGISETCIIMACKGRKKLAKGYQWRYENP